MAPKAPMYQNKKTLLAAVKETNDIYDLVLKLGNKSTEVICLSLQEVLNNVDHNKLVDSMSEDGMETLIAFNIIDGFIDEDLYSDELTEAIATRTDETIMCDEPVIFNPDGGDEANADDPETEETSGKKDKKKKKKKDKAATEEVESPVEKVEIPEWKVLQQELDENRDSMKKKKIKKMEKKIEKLKAAHRDELMEAHENRTAGKGDKKEPATDKPKPRTRGTGAIALIAKVLKDNKKDWMSASDIHKKVSELLGKDFAIATVKAQLGSGKGVPRIESEKGLCKVKVRGDKPADREFKYGGPVDEE